MRGCSTSHPWEVDPDQPRIECGRLTQDPALPRTRPHNAPAGTAALPNSDLPRCDRRRCDAGRAVHREGGGVGCVRPHAVRVDAFSSLRLAASHAHCPWARDDLSGRPRRWSADRGAAAGAGQERPLRALPGLDAVRELRRPAGKRRSRSARWRPKRCGSRMARASSCWSCGAPWSCRSICRYRTAR